MRRVVQCPRIWGYTGQRAETGLGSLYDYNARMYSPVLGRFISADTIVPDSSNPQSLNRFSYVRNNPLKYTDPTGHIEKYDEGGGEAVTCQQTNTCVTFWEYVENVILPVAAFFFDGAEYVELINQCRKGECTAGDILLTAIPTGIGKVFKTGAKTINKVDNLVDGVDAGTDLARAVENAGDADGLIRAVPKDQVGTSQPFKLRKGEDGVSVFEGVSPDEVLAELPGDRIPNTTVTISKNGLPPGTQVVPQLDPMLSQRLSEAHRILVRPQGWSIDRFAKALKKLVGWGE